MTILGTVFQCRICSSDMPFIANATKPAQPKWLSLLVLVIGLAFSTHAQIPGLTESEEPAAEAPAEPVEARADPGQDREIERRLEEIYATIGGLENVRVEVSSGIVSLSGEVLTEDAREQAVRLARQIRGVVEVEESIDRVRDVGRRLETARETLTDIGYDVVASLPLLAVALLVFVAFLLLARWVGRRDAFFDRIAANRFIADLVAQAVRAVIIVVGIFLALQIMDATALVAALAGTAGLVGLALGFAFRDLVENYIASVLLSLRQPFLPHDHVLIEEHEGKVVRLTSRATILITLDGNHVRIPNAQVFKGVITNYTRNPRRRFDFTVGVDVETELAEALALGLETLRATPGVLEDPPPQGWVEALGDSNVVVHLFAWVDQRETEFAKGRGEAIRRVKVAFDEAGIAMPEPIYNLKIQERALEDAIHEEGPDETVPEVPEELTDLSPDTHLDEEVAEERRQEKDLLDSAGPQE